MKCYVCGKECKGEKGLGIHLKLTHLMDKQKYIAYIKKDKKEKLFKKPKNIIIEDDII